MSKIYKLSIFLIFCLFFLWLNFVKAQTEGINLSPVTSGCLGSQAFVNLSWTSTISGNPTYYVQRKIEGQDDAAYITLISFTDTFSYPDNLVDSDKNYVYRIRAERGIDVFFSTPKTSLAAYCPPALLPATTTCASNGPRIGLTWSSVSGNLTTYKVYRDGQEIGSTTNPSYTDGPNIEGTKTYNYLIRAVWQNGNASNSQAVPVTALACPPTLNVAPPDVYQ